MKRLLTKMNNHRLVAGRPAVKQFVKFGLVGGLNTVIDYALFTTFFYVFHIHYLLANAMSFTIAVTNSYVLNRRWTFRSDNPRWHTEAIKFMVVNLIGLGLSESLLFILVDRLHIHQLIAKALAIIIVLFWNFIGTRFWAFRPTSPVK